MSCAQQTIVGKGRVVGPLRCTPKRLFDTVVDVAYPDEVSGKGWNLVL